MIICDGCESAGKINKHNCFMIKIDQTHETYHLCTDCVEKMKKAVFEQPKEEPKPVVKKLGKLKASGKRKE